MRNEISALVDGETEGHETRRILAALKTDSELREVWSQYHLIGDVLRGEPELGCDFTSEVIERLKDEPVVLAPTVRRRANWYRPMAAMAASVAGVAVVGWLAFSPQSPAPGVPGLQVVAAGAGVPTQIVASRDMQQYLFAHQTNVPGLKLQGASQHIRTVSVAEGGR
jgi:sigma-E factor negative regulatory protein RseA